MVVPPVLHFKIGMFPQKKDHPASWGYLHLWKPPGFDLSIGCYRTRLFNGPQAAGSSNPAMTSAWNISLSRGHSRTKHSAECLPTTSRHTHFRSHPCLAIWKGENQMSKAWDPLETSPRMIGNVNPGWINPKHGCLIEGGYHDSVAMAITTIGGSTTISLHQGDYENPALTLIRTHWPKWCTCEKHHMAMFHGTACQQNPTHSTRRSRATGTSTGRHPLRHPKRRILWRESQHSLQHPKSEAAKTYPLDGLKE